MNPLAIAGAVAGGQYLIESQGGWLALVGRFGNAAAVNGQGANGQGTGVTTSAGNDAAVAFMRGLGSAAGIPVVVDPQAPGMASIWSSMRASVTDATNGAALATAYLGAYDAARAADPVNYSTLPGGYSGGNLLGTTDALPCALRSPDSLNSLGTAGCALSVARDNYGGGDAWLAAFGINASQADNTQIIDAIASLTAEMDAAGYTTEKAQPSYSVWTLQTVEGGIAYAAGKSVQAVASGAASVLGSVAGAVLGSPLFWAAALGLVVVHVAVPGGVPGLLGKVL